ncbi:hypothetical protein ALC152_03920 [Arcobacter sp. 15-2]|uniref:hypothetical protein n=1 Tax=Arcobacter sp. 15-2 TaxID=3374109 RepID=UPI00399D0EF1
MVQIDTSCPVGYHWVWTNSYSGYCKKDDYVPPTEPSSTLQPLEVLGTEEEIKLNKHLSNINKLLFSLYSSLSTKQINNLIQGENLTSNQFLFNQQTLLKNINNAIGAENATLIGGTLNCESLFKNNTQLLKKLCLAISGQAPTLQGV